MFNPLYYLIILINRIYKIYYFIFKRHLYLFKSYIIRSNKISIIGQSMLFNNRDLILTHKQKAFRSIFKF